MSYIHVRPSLALCLLETPWMFSSYLHSHRPPCDLLQKVRGHPHLSATGEHKVHVDVNISSAVGPVPGCVEYWKITGMFYITSRQCRFTVKHIVSLFPARVNSGPECLSRCSVDRGSNLNQSSRPRGTPGRQPLCSGEKLRSSPCATVNTVVTGSSVRIAADIMTW